MPSGSSHMVSHTYDITRCGDQKMGFWFNYDFLGAPDISVCGDSIPAKLGCSAAGRNCNLRLTCITESWNLVFLAEGRQRRSARSSALAIGQSRLIPLRVEQCRLGGVSCLKRSISGNPRERYRTFFCFFWFCCRAIISCLPLELAGFVCCLFIFFLQFGIQKYMYLAGRKHGLTA